MAPPKNVRQPGPVGNSTSGGRQPGATGAKSLNPADARAILQASLPYVLQVMTASQVQQMQRVLNGAVSNPGVLKEAQDLYRRSIKVYGELTVKDPAMTRRADKVMQQYIFVKDADKRIRIDHSALLEPDALKARTDNGDEAIYMAKVGRTLANKGVWLRISPILVRDPDDPSRLVADPRQFEVWLSLGPDGQTIPTKSGRISRESLLGNQLIGANYYLEVHQGRSQAALNKEMRRLQSQIEIGVAQHNMFAKIRREAAPGVAEVSDVLGGADFPDRSIWDQPHKLLVRALELNIGGNISGSQAYLVVASILTRNAAKLLGDYINDSNTGVERAVTVLKVAKTAGEVAEVALTVTTVVGVVRAGAAAAGGAGARVATGGSVDVAAERLVRRYAAEQPAIAGDLAKVSLAPAPRSARQIPKATKGTGTNAKPPKSGSEPAPAQKGVKKEATKEAAEGGPCYAKYLEQTAYCGETYTDDNQYETCMANAWKNFIRCKNGLPPLPLVPRK